MAAALFAFLGGVFQTRSGNGLAPAAEWLRTEKMRAGYGVPLNETVLSKMQDSKMNAIIYPVRYFDGDDPEQVNEIREKAILCEKFGVRLFISIFYFVQDAGRHIEARRYVKGTGEEREAPCPLDWSYWESGILVQARALADLGKEVPIEGLILDTEMYTSERAHIYSPNGCFCDDCYESFLSGRSVASKAPRERDQRMGWLRDEELLDEYYEYLRKKVRSVADRVREEIRERNPEFLLGFLLYDHNWYYRGLTEGLGTAEMPVLVLDESTYGQGWGPLAMQMTEYFPMMGYDAFYIPGLWLAPLDPDRIESEAYYCGAKADGYWIFPFDSMYADPAALSGDFVLNGSQDLYWEALFKADSEIDERLLVGDGYESSIPYIPKPDGSISFGLVEGGNSIVIVNDGFMPRTDLKVAMNGQFVKKVWRIEVKSCSDEIMFEPVYTGSTGIYGQQGLNSVGVMERDGTIHDLLGSTPASAFG